MKMDLYNCDKDLKKVFGLTNFRTISNVENIIRISFSEELPYIEAYNLIKKIFDNIPIYIRITFWDKSEYEEKIFQKYLLDFREMDDDSIDILLRLDLKSNIIYDLLVKHLNYELAIDPSINITCFFFNIENKKILNIYDDRGADYISSVEI